MTGRPRRPSATRSRPTWPPSTPASSRRLTTLGPRAAARELTGTLNGQGIQVSERYVQQILDDWTAATRQQANGRRRTR